MGIAVRALESQVEAGERYQVFLQEGLRADQAMQQTGLGYEADAVHAYLESRARGRKARRPHAARWRG